MNYFLGYIRTTPPNRGDDPQNHRELNLTVDLTYEEYKQASDAISILDAFGAQAKLLGIVGLNYRDYLRVLRVTVPTYIQVRDRDRQEIDMEAIRLELNRFLVNYVTSVTLYLKRMEILIEKKHSDNTAYVDKFNSYRHQAYDSSFSYRFVYFLRNYAQHADLPIDGVEVTSAVNPDKPDVVTYSLRVFMRRDSLLQNYHYDSAKEKALRSEFSQLPPEIDLTPHLTTMMKALETLNSQFVKEELDTLKPSAAFLQELIRRLPLQKGDDPILVACEVVPENPAFGGGNTIRNMSLTYILTDSIRRVLADQTGNA
jgi:hypothetical protein